MAYKITNNSVNGIHDVKEFVVDTVGDMNTLPACGAGSTVFVVDGARVFIKNNEGVWKEI